MIERLSFCRRLGSRLAALRGEPLASVTGGRVTGSVASDVATGRIDVELAKGAS